MRRRPQALLLLTSSFGRFNSSKEPHAFYLAQWLLGQGIDPSRILPFVMSTNTVEDAVYARRALDEYNLGRVFVVTSEVHVRRARLIFEYFFDPKVIDVVGASNGVPDDVMAALEAHEDRWIRRITEQGGVLVDGRLVRAVLGTQCVKVDEPR